MDIQAHVTKLIDKAAGAERPDDAMKFAQAALNAANAWRVLQKDEQPF